MSKQGLVVSTAMEAEVDEEGQSGGFAEMEADDDDTQAGAQSSTSKKSETDKLLKETVTAIKQMCNDNCEFDSTLNEELVQKRLVKPGVPWQVFSDVHLMIKEWTGRRLIGDFEGYLTANVRLNMKFGHQLAVPDFAAVHQEQADQMFTWNDKMTKMCDVALKFQKEGSQYSEMFMGTLWSTFYEGWLTAYGLMKRMYQILKLCNEFDQILIRPHTSLSAVMGVFPSCREMMAPDPQDPIMFFHKVLRKFNELGYVKQGNDVLQMMNGIPFGFPIGSLEEVVSDVVIPDFELLNQFKSIRVNIKDLVHFLSASPLLPPVVRVRELFVVRGDMGSRYKFDPDTLERTFVDIPEEHRSGGHPVQVILMRRPDFDTNLINGEKKRCLKAVYGTPVIGPWSMIRHMCKDYLSRKDLGMGNVMNQDENPKCAVSYVGDLPASFKAHVKVNFDKPGFCPNTIPMDLFKLSPQEVDENGAPLPVPRKWKKVPLDGWRYHKNETSEIEIFSSSSGSWELVTDWDEHKMELSDPVFNNIFKPNEHGPGEVINELSRLHVPQIPRVPQEIDISQDFTDWDPLMEYIGTIPELAPYIRVLRWQDFDWNKVFTFIVHCVGRSIHGPSVDRHHYGVFVGGESNSGKTRVAVDAVEIWSGNTAARPAASNKNNFSLEQWIKGKTTWICNDMNGPAKDSALNADLFKNAVEGNKIEGPVKLQQKIDSYASDLNVVITANKYKITEVFPCPSESEQMALVRRVQSYIFKTSFKENPEKGIEPIPAETFKMNFAYYIALGHMLLSLSLCFSKKSYGSRVISSNPFAVNNRTQWVPKDICCTMGLSILAPAVMQMIEVCPENELEFSTIFAGGENKDIQPGLLEMIKKVKSTGKLPSKEKLLQSLYNEIAEDPKFFYREDDPVLTHDAKVEMWPNPEKFPLTQFIYYNKSAIGRLTDRDIQEFKDKKVKKGWNKLKIDKFRLKGWKLKDAYGTSN